MNEVTCIVFICDGIGPTALVAQRNGQGGYLGFLTSGAAGADQPGVIKSALYAKGVTGKTRRIVYPSAQASTRRTVSEEKAQRSCGAGP
ncbi:hypothetical protein [Pseudomonas sp. NPDC089547]|uniref:hypothetical protein n=1 Tax=Pseudomonas sp. NPDC089547 TaxID=3390652 RepID=UPI003D047AC7